MSDAQPPSDEELPGEELSDDEEPVEQAADDSAEDSARALVTNDRSVLLSETEDLAARHGLTVVLVAGEVDCGKTTLLVSIWNALLQHGMIGQASFAGSRTALGFERRAWLSRWASGGAEPDTERTREKDNGFLHLSLASDGRLKEVLFSDVAGETFKKIRQGTPIVQAIDWVRRTNHALFLVDGEAIADKARKSTALSNTRRLIAQFGKANAAASVAVVLAKSDYVDEEVRAAWEPEAKVLLNLARKVDEHAILLETAARPADAGSPRGVGDLVDRVLSTPSRPATEPGEASRAERMIGRVK